jgi:hypothetical protein
VFRTEEIVVPVIGRERRGTVASYVNPNAHCPVCNEPVFFYRSPYDGRVYFDALGWPWPKHRCTDRGYAPRHTQPGTKPAREPDWIKENWRPVLSMRVHADAAGRVVTGDVEETFLELHLAKAAPMDEHSPVFVRRDSTRPELFEVTYLSSDPLGVHRQTAVAFDPRIRSLGADIVASAAAGDPAANRVIGEYLLLTRSPWDAIPYLELAALKGDFEAQIELAVLLLFVGAPKLH